MISKPHLILLGGFLGSGKTTAAARLADHLQEQGLRVGLITNDQGSNLVDTHLLRGLGFATEEISGGCFCCRFEALVGASHRLAQRCRPDVTIAEAVGSCTDLAATVLSPLQRMHSANYTLAPLSVLVDPVRARRAFGLQSGRHFSADVRYIYRKQLEEANLIVISKSDLLESEQREELRSVLAGEFPHAEVLCISSHQDTNVADWLHRLLFGRPNACAAILLDYGRYAEGEARLGWLNAAVAISATARFNPGDLLLSLATEINRRLRGVSAEVAHLKIALQATADAGAAIAVINLVRDDLVPETWGRPSPAISEGRLVINLRAEANSRLLADIVQETLSGLEASARGQLTLRTEKSEAFSPGRPQPTHRDKILT
jgi:G3E family GTPase